MKNYCIAISVVEYAGILRKGAKKNRIQFSFQDIFKLRQEITLVYRFLNRFRKSSGN
ncbi:hypothetical protein SAMN05444394_0164 [Algoriphagus halophilus]|uniref:Four helix bundle protein n=1 Tax=Algoriphagus halophilus TaxID=226505 RepID=A0A1N6D443_9BACT|nr:hypothetical protein SAMN05444394_0164 [Algoriphagus halophilus]